MLRLLRARARHLFVPSAAAGLGLALSAGGFNIAAAHAATGALYPGIQGLGSITGDYGGLPYSCTAPAPADPTTAVTTISTCSQALVDGLVGGTLTAAPATGYQFASWSNCPSGDTSPTCNLGPLSGLVAAPTATFTALTDAPVSPETTVTGGPKNHGWLLATATKFRLSSTPSGATYTCTLDGKALEGCTNPVELTRLAQRTHVFKAAAGLLGVTDSTPEVRTFTVPVNNTNLRASAGWATRKAKGHFLNTFSQTKRHGATLKVRRSAIRSVALVVTKGRGYGTVNVYLGKTLLKKVSLSANRAAGKRVVPIKRFSSKKRGTITVKVVSRGKLVRIEGLGISSR